MNNYYIRENCMRIIRFFKTAASFPLKAGFTLEAAVIVPLSLVIICTMILLSFYIHDKIVFKSAGVRAVFENRSEDTSAIRSSVLDALENGLIMTRNTDVSCEINDDSASVQASGNFNWGYRMISGLFQDSLDTMSEKISISNLDGRSIILKYALADDLKELLKGEEKDTGGKNK